MKLVSLDQKQLSKYTIDPEMLQKAQRTDLAEKIASHYGVETINVLTGFKFIGEVIGRLEQEGREFDYICGFEDSYLHLTANSHRLIVSAGMFHADFGLTIKAVYRTEQKQGLG